MQGHEFLGLWPLFMGFDHSRVKLSLKMTPQAAYGSAKQ